MDISPTQIVAIVSVSVTAVFCAVMLTLLRRARGPKEDPARRRERSRKPHRAALAAMAVFPGALLVVWVVASGASGGALGVAFGWIPALFIAALLSVGAYGAVRMCRHGLRTRVTASLAIVMNSVYALALWAYVEFMA